MVLQQAEHVVPAVFIADHCVICPTSIENEPLDNIRMFRYPLSSEACPHGETEQFKARSADRFGNRRDRCQLQLGRPLSVIVTRQSAAGQVEADQGAAMGERVVEESLGGLRPAQFQMAQPPGNHQEARPAADTGECDPATLRLQVRGSKALHACTHITIEQQRQPENSETPDI